MVLDMVNSPVRFLFFSLVFSGLLLLPGSVLSAAERREHHEKHKTCHNRYQLHFLQKTIASNQQQKQQQNKETNKNKEKTLPHFRTPILPF